MPRRRGLHRIIKHSDLTIAKLADITEEAKARKLAKKMGVDTKFVKKFKKLTPYEKTTAYRAQQIQYQPGDEKVALIRSQFEKELIEKEALALKKEQIAAEYEIKLRRAQEDLKSSTEIERIKKEEYDNWKVQRNDLKAKLVEEEKAAQRELELEKLKDKHQKKLELLQEKRYKYYNPEQLPPEVQLIQDQIKQEEESFHIARMKEQREKKLSGIRDKIEQALDRIESLKDPTKKPDIPDPEIEQQIKVLEDTKLALSKQREVSKLKNKLDALEVQLDPELPKEPEELEAKKAEVINQLVSSSKVSKVQKQINAVALELGEIDTLQRNMSDMIDGMSSAAKNAIWLHNDVSEGTPISLDMIRHARERVSNDNASLFSEFNDWYLHLKEHFEPS